MDNDAKVRLFVGAEVSMAAVKKLAAAAEAMRAMPAARDLALRWVSPASYHVTLKFLGWVRAPAVAGVRDAVTAAVSAAAQSPFSMHHEGVGAFPGPERAQVLWAGTGEGADPLATLAAAMEEALCALGFRKEARAFHPHVTLARIKAPGDVREMVAAGSEQVYSQSRVDAVVLYESQLKSTGSEYRVSARFPLAGP